MQRGLRVLVAVAILFPAITSVVQAETTPDLFITEVQTSSQSSGSQEYIELYNNTDSDIDLADTQGGGRDVWKIQYFSSTKVVQSDFSWDTTAPSGEIALTGTIAAHEYYLLSTSINGVTYTPGNVTPDQTYSSSHLSDTAGGVQLAEVNSSATKPHDHVGWSSSNSPPNSLYASPQPGGSLQRQVDNDGNYMDEQGNLGPFVPSATASPKEAWQTPTPDDDTGQTDNSTAPPATLQLTELLPNPASPATDASDEFVELYNYGDEPIDLDGFIIQTGLTYAYSYTISNGTVAPHAFVTFTSGDTPLALTNSGGQARLLSPGGQVIDETAAYSDAPEGEAWALFGDSWQWTNTPTPAAANMLTLPPPTSAKPTVKKAATPAKVKKAAATNVKAKKTTAANGTAGNNGDNAAADQPPALHPAVLAGVGGAALLYGAYEYRTDVANRLYQLRRYRATRRAARAAVKGA